MDWLKPGTVFDFMGYRPYFLGLSLLLLLGTAVAFFKPGPRLGTDFEGGTEVEIAFQKDVAASDVREAVIAAGFSSPDVVRMEDPEQPSRFLIRVKEVTTLTDEQRAAIQSALCRVPEEGELLAEGCPKELQTHEVKFSPGGEKVSARYVNPDVCGPPQGEVKCPPREDLAAQLRGKVQGVNLRKGQNAVVVQNEREGRVEFFLQSKGDEIMDGLRTSLGADVVPAAPLRVEWIGPRAGKQLRDDAITSVAIALIFIMAYIAFRFDMRFAPGAIAALLHDVTLAIGAMILAQREITLSTVAALLTIVGYSINDTVVVYDRIRENLGKYRKSTFPKIVNRSVTEMLGRTIRTSATTAVAMIPFLIWGTGVIKDFAFTLLVGVVAGTYSSIYVAAPLTEYIDRKLFGGTAKTTRRGVKRKNKSAVSAPAV